MTSSYEELLKWTEYLEKFKVGEFHQWPDIDLYMDQVISYLERYVTPLRTDENEKIVTPSIINNNTKDGVLPKPVKKKYSRQLLSILLIFSTLRQVIPTQNMAVLLNTLSGAEDYPEVHNQFARSLEQCLSETSKMVRDEVDGLNMEDKLSVAVLAMKLAIEADAKSLAARKLLSSLHTAEKERAAANAENSSHSEHSAQK
ncbi:MAG: DUF1836 domain-containing protein [Oscillospiraceae bacterium]|jgi:hypothetical protein|nr:DUF1836 domain-containing protein [Oscillospiraceae bacterium]